MGVAIRREAGAATTPIRISVASRTRLELGIGALPDGVSSPHSLGAALPAGVEFTFSPFVAGLAIPKRAEASQEAKAGIPAGSRVAVAAGVLGLRLAGEGDR